MQNSGLRESKSVGVGIESLTLWPTNGSVAWPHNWCLIETRKSGNGKWITFRGQLARRFRNKSKTKASFRPLQFRDACPALRIWFGYGYSFSFAFIYFFFFKPPGTATPPPLTKVAERGHIKYTQMSNAH